MRPQRAQKSQNKMGGRVFQPALDDVTKFA
jgi:hypothetical protein